MFDIIIKKLKVYIDCYTYNINALEFFPIKPADQFYPVWWKNLSKQQTTTDNNGLSVNRATMKSCNGFTDLYQQGIILPLWSDVVIETMANGFRYNFAEGDHYEIGHHDYEQMSTEFSKYIHLKFVSPWRIQENTEVKFIFFQPTYNQVQTILDWHIMPGVLDFKYQNATNVNVLAPRGRKFEIPAGHPMAHIVPLTDKEIVVKTHFLDKTDLDKTKLFGTNYPFFQGSYRKMKKITQENERNQCPIGRIFK